MTLSKRILGYNKEEDSDSEGDASMRAKNTVPTILSAPMKALAGSRSLKDKAKKSMGIRKKAKKDKVDCSSSKGIF
jgi:hypothetical protein